MRVLSMVTAAGLFLVPGLASSATLGLATIGPISTGSGTFDYVAGVELSSFDVMFVSGPSSGAMGEVFFDPLGLFVSAISLDGEIADIVATGFQDDLIELQIEPMSGYADGALMTLSNFGLGPNPISALEAAGDATYSNVAVTLQSIDTAIGIIPVPATGLLLVSGIALMGAGFRRQSR